MWASICFCGYPLLYIALGLFMHISFYLAIIVGHEKQNGDYIEEVPEIIKFLKYWINIIIGGLLFGIIGQTFYFPCL